MGDLLPLLILSGGLGWFLLTYVLGLGKKGPLRTLVWTAFYWIILSQLLAIAWNTIGPVILKAVKEGDGFIVFCFLVLLPYLLAGLRVYWLRRHWASGRIPIA